MRFLFLVLLLILQLSCVPDNLYLRSPELYEKPTAGVGCLQSRIIRESNNIKYSAEIYNFPFYFSYGKVLPSGWGIGMDLMFPSLSFLNAKLVTPKKQGFFASLTVGLSLYYLPYTLSMLIGKEITKEILVYGGITTSDLLILYGDRPPGNTDNFRFTYPIGLRIKILNRVNFISEVILPVISDEALLHRELLAYPKFGSAFFYSLK
jgi:hypothetical protein